MDFFDRVSKTVSDTGQKAKDMADIAGLNNKVSNNEREINKLYEQIGSLYYSEHSKDPEQKFQELVNEISELQDQIYDWNDQIQQLKGYIKCPDCGEYVEKDVLECPNCGHSFIPEGAVVCPNCGALITEPDVVFCQYCGTPLDRQSESEPEPEVVLEPGPIQCKCGAILEVGVNFCPKCGTSREELERSQNNDNNQ